ncbi:transcription regulator padr n-terminal [Lucifera butyrica]|uniref:Transcription regulator padr n-terminal n=1 Tax=Lucifera butyrica TaxID=1351585 RepID=A0A498RIL8_9FIRM|nr:PadR family transcriptional regulator [Lucifera butyrica]VBB09892.1 transcription regulator padr n-terminal [Lucifera butyrica]
MNQDTDHRTWMKIILALYILKILQAEGPMHGNKLAEEVKRRSLSTIIPNPNALYPLLRILEERGYITGHWEHPSKRSKRAYSITEAGIEHIPSLQERVTNRFNQVQHTMNILRKDLLEADGGEPE